MDPNAIGLIMQGGGALGAYEYGAVTCLLDHGFKPVVVSGVSIGAINSAVIAGARGGDAKARLQELWRRISLSPIPFLPADQQATLSMFGNPGFWRSRLDMHNLFSWTSLCDVSPMPEAARRGRLRPHQSARSRRSYRSHRDVRRNRRQRALLQLPARRCR